MHFEPGRVSPASLPLYERRGAAAEAWASSSWPSSELLQAPHLHPVVEERRAAAHPQSTFSALTNGDLLLGTFAATLPAADVAQKPGGYVLLRLRHADELTGTMIAYASPEGLRHLYPFAVRLRRV
ncbi:MAG TPA: hypothetical protein VJ276_14620 [Thermoanaerobaculia bacterium]|nr:hypothetical protein [Thermoanaerobaculia bacterium]